MSSFSLIKGINLSSTGLSISHLQFTDDTVLFVEASSDYILSISYMLRCFALTSSLVVNFHKSKLIGINLD